MSSVALIAVLCNNYVGFADIGSYVAENRGLGLDTRQRGVPLYSTVEYTILQWGVTTILQWGVTSVLQWGVTTTFSGLWLKKI